VGRIDRGQVGRPCGRTTLADLVPPGGGTRRAICFERRDGDRGATWGAIKVYSAAAGSYDDHSEDLLHRFAGQAAIFVSNVHTAQSAQRIGDELKQMLRSRDAIATARGMVMARTGVDSEQAYRQLVLLAGRSRIPLSQLAERMVAAPARRNPSREQCTTRRAHGFTTPPTRRS
jgi:hypothetical protein